jgi:transcriptional antiterminator RfaH
LLCVQCRVYVRLLHSASLADLNSGATMAFRWYVASIKPKGEARAAEELDRQGFYSYFPRNRVRRVRRGRVIDGYEPLFRGYILVALDIEGDSDKWRSVNSTKAVNRLLPSGESPLPLLDSDVEALRHAERAGYFRSGVVVPGEKLRVFKGTLAGRVLECLSSSGDRVSALWDCFGQRVVVSVALADVTVLR